MADYDLVIRGGTVIDGRGGAPRMADVAVKDGVIALVGQVRGKGAEEIDATGLAVTPGFVDVHTHYDGQITWENRLAPSSNHGVTTVVMGNCGVGFAPVRPTDHELVIRLMEGVEDIPHVVMSAGVPWNWETFEDYLDALDQRESDVDFATQIPHSPLRVYVMGERGGSELATDEDLAKMRAAVASAVKAGALGFSTSRNLFHRFRNGVLAPSVKTEREELIALAAGLKDAGSGVFQLNPFLDGDADEEMDLFRTIAASSGRPLNYSLIYIAHKAENWPVYVDDTAKANAEGLKITAQYMPRPMGVMYGLDLTYHPFSLNPSYREIARLPLAEKVARMRDPEFRARLISEEPDDPNPAFVGMLSRPTDLYPLKDPINYDFHYEDSLTAQAEREGRPVRELIYDALLEDEGRAVLCSYSSKVPDYLERSIPLIARPDMVMSLGDGGAHYGMICDAAYTTYVLSQRLGKDGIDLPLLIEALTQRPALSVGLADRGVVAEGYKADINLIDVARLGLSRPAVTADLPAGGKRLTQRSTGYVATIVSGAVTYRDGTPTGALPGRLVRGAKPTPIVEREREAA